MERLSTQIQSRLAHIYELSELRNITQLIWCDILGRDKLDIYLGKDTNLSISETEKVEKIIERLLAHEPIQYIEGKTPFCGHWFNVAPGVLIPRPETSELIDLICKNHSDGQLSILDVGTGSGCIAISLALHYPDANVAAWDISEDALVVARQNNEQLGTHVAFQQQDVLAVGSAEKPLFDIIVSNPPYITPSEKLEMDANVLDWEPHTALFVEEDDPLLFYRTIAVLGQTFLKPHGWLYFEINRAYGKEMKQMLEQQGYANIEIVKDISGNDRMTMAQIGTR